MESRVYFHNMFTLVPVETNVYELDWIRVHDVYEQDYFLSVVISTSDDNFLINRIDDEFRLVSNIQFLLNRSF
jgi:hypothetical protein